MNVEVKEGQFDRSAYNSGDANQVEIRDNQGNLVMFVRLLRDGNTIIVSKTGEDDFEWNARQHQIPLKKEAERERADSKILLG